MMRHVTCKTYPVQRGKGQSAVAGAAYRAGVKLTDEREGKTVDYSRRSPDVRDTFILAPENAPDWCHDRQTLWNAAEAMEKRKDARPAREVQLGLAVELAPERQRQLVTAFAKREFVDKGYVVDVAIHDYGQRVIPTSETGRNAIRRWAALDFPFLEARECEGLYEPHVKIERDRDGDVIGYKVYQPHAHCYVTGRPLDGDRFAAKKPRTFNSFEAAKEWRYEWPKLQNAYLAEDGYDVRVSALGENEDPDPAVRQLRENQSRETYAMELRGEPERMAAEAEADPDAPTWQRLEDEALETNRIHNETIREAQASLAAEHDPAVAAERETTRQIRAWELMARRFHDWKDRFREKADEWRERFALQAERIRSRFPGWTLDRDATQEAPPDGRTPDGPVYRPPEQEPER